jgi:nicotinamidase-related amidase
MRHPNIARHEDAFLVVVDMQEAFWNLVWQKERVLKAVRLLLECARPLNLPVIVTEQNPSKVGRTVAPLADLTGGARLIEKMTFSCCSDPTFMSAVESLGRGTAIVCGIETQVCIMETSLDLVQAGYQVHVPADAVTSRGEINWTMALENMRAAGVIITTVDAVLFQLLECAGTDEFRAVMSLVKSAALWS